MVGCGKRDTCCHARASSWFCLRVVDAAPELLLATATGVRGRALRVAATKGGSIPEFGLTTRSNEQFTSA
jgi:hypothetical protein